MNIFTNSPLPYYPCSLTCAKSIEYVERLLFAFSILDSDISDFLKKILSEPVSLYWTCADKIFLYGDFKQPILGQGEIKYERIEVWLNSKTFYQAVDKNQIKKWNLIAEYLKKQAGVDEVQFQKDIIDRLLTLTNILRIISLVFFVFLVITTGIILITTTSFKIALKKEEIELLKLI
ncbi:MAG: hypothetical protein ACP5KX_08065, partial [Caldisericia bacterium]